MTSPVSPTRALASRFSAIWSIGLVGVAVISVGAGVGFAVHAVALRHAERALDARAAMVVSGLTSEQFRSPDLRGVLGAYAHAAGFDAALIRGRNGEVLVRSRPTGAAATDTRTEIVPLRGLGPAPARATVELSADAGAIRHSARRAGTLAALAADLVLLLLVALVLLLLRRTRMLVSRAEDEALTDHLTALPTRALFDDRLTRACVQADREGGELAIMVIDLDRFKPVNDEFGHAAGDAVLREVACRLVGAVREADTVARLGGDEFGVVLLGLGGAEVRATALRIHEILDRNFHVGDAHIALDASVGIALYPANGRTPAELLHHADAAMYAAKHAGLQYAFAETGGVLLKHERATLRSELAEGVRRGELLLHYQPRIDLATGVTSCFEALLRWMHPTRGILPAAAFVPSVDGALARRLFASTLENTLAEVAMWQRETLDASIAVNIDEPSLRDPRFPHRFATLLERYGVDPARVEVDIPFAAVGTDVEPVVKSAHRLAELGVVLVLDDFAGNRFAPSVIGALPISRLKLDASLVHAASSSSVDGALLSATVSFAQRLGLTVAAEGVEDAAILAFVRELGVDHAQGFHVGRPVEAHGVVDLAALGSAA